MTQTSLFYRYSSAVKFCFGLAGLWGMMTNSLADYSTWVAAQIADPLRRATSDDPDADGVDNLTEYALGTSPLLASSAVDLGLSGLAANASFPWAGREDVSFIWEISPSLGLWTPLAANAESQSFTASGALWRQTSVVSASLSRQFFRLRPLLDPPLTGADDDGDGASNAWEAARLTDSSAIDSDADGLADSWESATGQNPTSPLTPASSASAIALEVFTPSFSLLQK